MSKRFLAVALWSAFASIIPASAYTYYVHYNGNSGPYQAIPEKFDVNSLDQKAIRFFISDSAPSALAPGDSFPALISEFRTAAKVWSDVQTSDLRLAFGGLYTTGTEGGTPAIFVDFSDDIPPGLLAMSGPEVKGDVSAGPNGNFIPIARSRMFFKKDLSQYSSYSELLFTTMVHEFGHAIGLQHTFTSAAMSTAVTSASTRAEPLLADDIAGISLLYPVEDHPLNGGSISGRVTLSGTGVGFASVVAIPVSGPAVSALTNPDGTYQIAGIPPGDRPYLVYAHPLPPALMGESYPGNVFPAKDSLHPDGGRDLVATQNFATQFYPNTRDWTKAQQIWLNDGDNATGINFSVSARNAPAISSVRSYGYSSAGVPETSPPLTFGTPAAMVLTGNTGLLSDNTQPVAGLAVSTLGSTAQVYNTQTYLQQYLLTDLYVNNSSVGGTKHLLFGTPNDLYVLPSAFHVVYSSAPSISAIATAVDSNGNKAVIIDGGNLRPDTRFYFDGVPGVRQGFLSDNRTLVTLPPGAAGYTAAVVALNSDGQSSLFTQSSPPLFTCDGSTPAAVLNVYPASLIPGTDNTVDILVTGSTGDFADKQTSVGFGSSDAVVKQVTVLSPAHLSVVVAVPASANPIPTQSPTITTGLHILSPVLGTQVLTGTAPQSSN